MTEFNSQLSVREIREQDFGQITELAAQLGYPTDVPTVKRRSASLLRDADGNLLRVAVLGDRVIGWVHAMVHLSLITEPRVEIAGLVVDEQVRGRGVGRLLMAAAEAWAKDQGLSLMRLSSQTKRVDAHRFYEQLGYEIQKTSHVLTKRLS